MGMRRLCDWERQAIVDAMIAGEKREAIAAEFDIADHYPRMLARRHGVPPRGRGRPKKVTRLNPRASV